MEQGEPVSLSLTPAEALVLFDFLTRFNDLDGAHTLFADQAEQRVLWNLESLLEKVLIEPFMPNYRELVQQARDELRDTTA